MLPSFDGGLKPAVVTSVRVPNTVPSLRSSVRRFTVKAATVVAPKVYIFRLLFVNSLVLLLFTSSIFVGRYFSCC